MSMSEKDMFLMSLEREVQTTVKLLRNYPADRLEFTPHERSKKAKDLAWIFVGEQSLMTMALDGEIKFGPGVPAPATMPEIITALEASTKKLADRIKKMPDEDYNSTVKFFTGPNRMADLRKADVLWFVLMDHVHHRGQFSVYLRMTGGKVPSIYGPSADEPWM